MRQTIQLAALFAALTPTAAHAELPEGVRAMIEAAIETKNATKVATVFEMARKTNPEELETLDAMKAEWDAAQAEREVIAAQEKEAKIREAGLLQMWNGQGELGGFRSSGNTDSTGIAASLKLKREGIEWSHRITARADYQRLRGATSREQFLFAYEPRWQFDEDMFIYGLAQFERDRIQGFSGRYAVSGGLGVNVVDNDDISLSLKAGPAWRVTNFTDGDTENRLAGLVGVDFDWQIMERLSFTQDANALAETGGQATVIFDGSNTTLNLISGLDFKVSNRLRSRLSYHVDYNSNPPLGKVKTDTTTRASLVYGF